MTILYSKEWGSKMMIVKKKASRSIYHKITAFSNHWFVKYDNEKTYECVTGLDEDGILPKRFSNSRFVITCRKAKAIMSNLCRKFPDAEFGLSIWVYTKSKGSYIEYAPRFRYKNILITKRRKGKRK